MARMGKKLAEMFCDFVSGPGLPSNYREFSEWADASCPSQGTAFWQELALCVRDCGHEHAAFALYRLASGLASELQRDKEFIGGVGRVFEECVSRFGVDSRDIRKEDE